MEIKIPKIRVPLELSEYSPELEGHTLYVWVNPPRRLKEDYFQASLNLGDTLQVVQKPGDFNWIQKLVKGKQRERSSKKIVRWYAGLWSETEDGGSYNGRDIEHFAEEIIESDPALWAFLCNKTWTMINEFLSAAKKAQTTPR